MFHLCWEVTEHEAAPGLCVDMTENHLSPVAQLHRNTFEAFCGIFQSHSLPPSLSCEVLNLELVVVTTAFTTCIYTDAHKVGRK